MTEFEINNKDANILGVVFLEGVYDELTKLPVPKDTIVNDWADQHGKERDLNARFYKSRQLSLPVMIEGNDRLDFLAKKQAFNNLLIKGYFYLKSSLLQQQYKLIYIEAINYKDCHAFCTLTLIVEDDYPHLINPA